MPKTTQNKYYEGIGGRKSSSARVRLYPDEKGDFTINGKQIDEYFSNVVQVAKSKQPLESLELNFKVSAMVKGGGINSQSEAIRHGLSRALEKYDQENRKKLKGLGYLTRDSRKKERKKPGKTGARRSPQWRKR